MARGKRSKHMQSPIPETNYEKLKEVKKLEEKFQEQSEAISKINRAELKAPLEEKEQQTKISQKEARKYDAPFIKPVRSIGCNAKEKPLESLEPMRKRAWEYVKCVVENYETIGEPVECWTKRFAGDNYDFWIVPVNTPIYIPRLLADQLSKCKYHRIIMKAQEGSEGRHTETAGVADIGIIEVKNEVQRISCKEVGSGFEFMKTAIL